MTIRSIGVGETAHSCSERRVAHLVFALAMAQLALGADAQAPSAARRSPQGATAEWPVFYAISESKLQNDTSPARLSHLLHLAIRGNCA